MSEVNIPLLRKVVAWEEAEAAKPEELCQWLQARYITGQPGETIWYHGDAYVAGDSVVWDSTMWGRSAECGTCFCIAGKAAFDATGNMDYLAAHDIAKRELGLTETQADVLFHANNTIEDVRRIAEEIAGEKL